MSHSPSSEDLQTDREDIKVEIQAHARTGKILNERPEGMSYDAYRTLLILQKKFLKIKSTGKFLFKSASYKKTTPGKTFIK